MERIIHLEQDGRRLVFTIDRRGTESYWRVTSEGREFAAPLRVTGDELPDFFHELAKIAVKKHGL